MASPASPGAGLSFDSWPVLSGFHSSNAEKKWPNVKNRVEFQSGAGLRKVARTTPVDNIFVVEVQFLFIKLADSALPFFATIISMHFHTLLLISKLR